MITNRDLQIVNIIKGRPIILPFVPFDGKNVRRKPDHNSHKQIIGCYNYDIRRYSIIILC